MNAVYLVPGAAVQEGGGIPGQVRGEYHWLAIPGDPQGRVILLARHVDDADEDTLRGIPGVVAFPNVLLTTPLTPGAVNLLGGFNVGITIADTVGSALEKLRAVWPKAAATWR